MEWETFCSGRDPTCRSFFWPVPRIRWRWASCRYWRRAWKGPRSKFEQMTVRIFDDGDSLALAAAEQAAVAIREAIAERNCCRVMLATGNSQLQFLDALTRMAGIDWNKVEAFHLDEYVGIPVTHPASFRKFLLERVIHKAGITKYHFVEGDAADLSLAICEVSAP